VRVGVQCADGVYTVDADADELLGYDAEAHLDQPPELRLGLPRILSASVGGSTLVAVLDRRPPLAVSHDAGRTWRESGAGLPPGRGVAVSEDEPDRIVFAARNRLYLSLDGGLFWRALTPELPEIESVAWLD
jgi:hypothetical protein